MTSPRSSPYTARPPEKNSMIKYRLANGTRSERSRNLKDEVVPEVSLVGKEVAVEVSLAELEVDQGVH